MYSALVSIYGAFHFFSWQNVWLFLIMKIVFLSHHYYFSNARAGFHHLAEALHASGHTVVFATTGISWLSYLRRDPRVCNRSFFQDRNTIREVKDGFLSYVHFTALHPHSLVFPFLNRITHRFFDAYAYADLGLLLPHIEEADCIIYESSPSLFLFEKCKQIAPSAKHVYRVSDDIRVLRSTHPRLIEIESTISPMFDLVSVPCQCLADKFPHKSNVKLQKHGIVEELFSGATSSPYTTDKNCVFVGNAYLDEVFVEAASAECSDVNFHIIGNFRPRVSSANVHYHGEMPFAKTIPWIKFADVGLQTLAISHGRDISSFTDTNKVRQYSYCGLPIVAPQELQIQREGVFYYDRHAPASCSAAVRSALSVSRTPAFGGDVQTWREVALEMIAAE
ncbi:hypothetical protein N1030_13740 [Desulfovibrio mangrovi]|uniref:GumK N-terminal domain-containing glycosyltransferase n=1 Tax=Desulfovibrio mangrovi TaxID=2976983 RepID=UPI0022472591|nr:hypothetical protein [Desulfovibrio mangrovi]UZP66662.1 hypothetical protein N1030_13740 [Desulfovibrio mangrovi]